MAHAFDGNATTTSASGGLRLGQLFLQKNHCSALAPLLANLRHPAGLYEAHGAVQDQRRFILGIDRADDDLFALLARQVDQCGKQRPSYTFAARSRRNVNEVLNGLPKSLIRAEWAERTKGKYLPVVLSNQHREAIGLARSYPFATIFSGDKLLDPDRRRMFDLIVEN